MLLLYVIQISHSHALIIDIARVRVLARNDVFLRAVLVRFVRMIVIELEVVFQDKIHLQHATIVMVIIQILLDMSN